MVFKNDKVSIVLQRQDYLEKFRPDFFKAKALKAGLFQREVACKEESSI